MTPDLPYLLRTAEARLEQARKALIGTGYFTAAEVGDDVAPRITELAAHYESRGCKADLAGDMTDGIRQLVRDEIATWMADNTAEQGAYFDGTQWRPVRILLEPKPE